MRTTRTALPSLNRCRRRSSRRRSGDRASRRLQACVLCRRRRSGQDDLRCGVGASRGTEGEVGSRPDRRSGAPAGRRARHPRSARRPFRHPLPSHAPGGELHAAMLETKASADEIIRRAADDQARAQRVLDNRIYQAFSNTLARSHAYAAMERVHEAVHDPRYDLVVVDTPPAQSSIEILDAPARLVRFLDQRVVRWFLQASDDSPTLRGGAIAQRLLRTVAGDSLVSALTEFLTEMAFLREGFAERARDVRDLMRSPSASFVLVSSADSVGNRGGQIGGRRGREPRFRACPRGLQSGVHSRDRSRRSRSGQLSGLACGAGAEARADARAARRRRRAEALEYRRVLRGAGRAGLVPARGDASARRYLGLGRLDRAGRAR